MKLHLHHDTRKETTKKIPTSVKELNIKCKTFKMLGKIGKHVQKHETGPLSYSIRKNTFKIHEKPKRET